MLLTYVISAENQPDLLARTVMLFHGMAIPIYGLNMRRRVDSETTRIEVQVVAQPEKSERIALRLAKILHVTSVRTRSAALPSLL